MEGRESRPLFFFPKPDIAFSSRASLQSPRLSSAPPAFPPALRQIPVAAPLVIKSSRPKIGEGGPHVTGSAPRQCFAGNAQHSLGKGGSVHYFMYC